MSAAGMGEPLLETRGLSKRFGGLAALEGVDLTIRRGEIVGLLGPNGAGKTTLVNCLTGLERPSAGRIAFRGRDVTGGDAWRLGRLGLARTFQVVKPFRDLTVRENVLVGALFGAGGQGRSAGEAGRRADAILARVGLARRQGDPASALTIPDLKRLELAKALAMEPELLFLDEVMAGLNASEVAGAMELVRAIHAEGVTLLVIEHVMQAVMGLSDRVCVLQEGRKIAEGTPAEVAESPEVIRAYLGERYARLARERRDGKTP